MSVTGRPDGEPEAEGRYGTWSDAVIEATDRTDLDELLDALEDVLAMEPADRFTRSALRLHDVFFDESFTDTVSEMEESPVSGQMYEEFDHVWSLFQSSVLKQLRESRKDEARNLLLGIYLEKAQEAFIEADRRADSGGEVKRPLSTFIALSCRLLQLLFGDEVSEDHMYRDVLWADYYLSQPSPLDIQDPADIPIRTVRQRVRLEAAVVAYREVDISVSRGAELAGVPAGVRGGARPT